MKSKKALTRTGILATLHAHQSTLDKYKVKKIGLFGSYAKGSQRRRSDIDFVVEFEEPTYDNFIGLINDLEKLFGKQVDLLTPQGVEGIRIREVSENIKKSVVYV